MKKEKLLQAANAAVVEKIVDYFYSGFLLSVVSASPTDEVTVTRVTVVPQVKPALLQDADFSVVSSTVYLQVGSQSESFLRAMFRRVWKR